MITMLEVINEFSNVDGLEDNIRYLDKKRHDLEETCSYLEEKEIAHAHRLSIYNECRKDRNGH